MANKVTTEWEDIHVKLGNYLPREKDPTNDELYQIALKEVENYDPLKNKTNEELKVMRELDDEDEELKAYEAKRLAELKALAAKPRFGKVYEIRKQDYIQEVNNAPKDVYVVLHLYQNYIEDSNVLGKIFDYMAKKYINVKFLKIVASDCVENFPDSSVPGVLIYYNGESKNQLFPATKYFGYGSKLSWKKVEWVLSSMKVIKTDVEEDPFEEADSEYNQMVKKKYRKERERDEDYSDDEDEYGKKDRDYAWKI